MPQGSVLGPLLFLIYINDIVNSELKGKILLYADDIALFYSGSYLEMDNKILHDLCNIQEWCQKNKFYLNEKKCCYIDIGKKYNNVLPQTNYKINNEVIKKVDCYKYLGIMIDSNLNFKEHIDYIISKISKLTGLFKRFSYFLNLHTKKLLYNSYIESNLLYLASVWGRANKNDLNRLQKCQNKAVKSLYNLPYDTHFDEVYSITEIFNVNEIIYQQEIKLIHKICINGIDTNLKLTERSSVHNYQTRNCNNLNFKKTNTTKAKKALMHHGIIRYNEIPNVLKQTQNIIKFKKQIKNFIFQNRK